MRALLESFATREFTLKADDATVRALAVLGVVATSRASCAARVFMRGAG